MGCTSFFYVLNKFSRANITLFSTIEEIDSSQMTIPPTLRWLFGVLRNSYPIFFLLYIAVYSRCFCKTLFLSIKTKSFSPH